MMFVLTFLLITAPTYADLEPFMDEASAAHAYETHIDCLGRAAFERRSDVRAAEIIAAEIIQACAREGDALRAALADVFRRKPRLIDVGQDAGEAANNYLSGAEARVEEAIRRFRSQGR